MDSHKDHFVALFKASRMTYAEIASEIGKTSATVEAILGEKPGQHYSDDTRDRVYDVIKKHAAQQLKSLSRLSARATG